MYTFRKSTKDDKTQLRKLFYECFGNIAHQEGTLRNIPNRYWIALHEEEIVAVTGILPLSKSNFNGYEVTWTCTNKTHRKKGLIVKMLKMAEKELPDDNIPIYCECWRIRNNDINLHSVMKHLNMHEIINELKRKTYPINKCCVTCPEQCKNCYCFSDLYIKNR